MYTLDELKSEVHGQAKNLDDTHPGWRGKIDLDLLAMESSFFHPLYTCGCILSQIEYYFRKRGSGPDWHGCFTSFLEKNERYRNCIAFSPNYDEGMKRSGYSWVEDVTPLWLQEIPVESTSTLRMEVDE